MPRMAEGTDGRLMVSLGEGTVNVRVETRPGEGMLKMTPQNARDAASWLLNLAAMAEIDAEHRRGRG